ncbi:LINE-1 reverse transcriptase isogeny [Artemisia annua]|uniref:LINE-1 reverse transcriptase isogeny n=1 Tax=Artemisia annua TaxID=35608 RepID=A0A2U1NTX7_ARTAN|nr:LINE-1 reverse transcriptase isogeny [Artemisia annua]
MSKLVSENQSAFIADRHLYDSVMLVNELWHLLKRSKKTALFHKLDFAKAYDSVSHTFLLATMKGMGFSKKFVSWITACISNVHFSVLINNSASKEGVMGQGLRQGDPLSPFLFILVTEVLSTMLSSALNRGILQGMFYRMSGLKVNLSKTALFGINLKHSHLLQFAQLMGCSVGSFPFEYLGIPIGINPTRINAWQKVIDKFKLKLSEWRGTVISDPAIGKAAKRLSVGWKHFKKKNTYGIMEDCLLLERLVGRKRKVKFSFWPFMLDLVETIWNNFKDYVLNDDGSISWDLRFNRDLSRCESRQVHELLTLLSHCKIDLHKVDCIQWIPGNNGHFKAARATFMLEHPSGALPSPWSWFVWFKHVLAKMHCFLWLGLHDAIPVKEIFKHRHVSLDGMEDLCSWCDAHTESISHLLLHCQWVDEIWKSLFLWWDVNWVMPQNLLQFVLDWNEGMSSGIRKGWKLIGPCTIWYIWFSRNNLIFNQKVSCWSKIVTKIKIKSFRWALNAKICSSIDFHIWLNEPQVFFTALSINH